MRLFIIVLVCLGAISRISAQNSRGIGAPANNPQKGTTYALIIGVSDYQNLPPLKYSTADARSLSDYLIQTQKIPENHVFCHVDRNASRLNIIDKLLGLDTVLRPGDQFIFYFSGHGDWESKLSENALLLLSNAPTKNYLRFADQYLDCHFLNDFLRQLADRQVKAILIADACHSGNLSGGRVGAENTVVQLKQSWKNVVRILSCMPDELSFEDVRWGGGRGVFSYYLTEGLKGSMHRNSKGLIEITMGDLRSFLETNVVRETKGKQTPVLDGDPRFIVARIDRSKSAAPPGSPPTTGSSQSIAKGILDTSSQAFRTLLLEFDAAIVREELVGSSAKAAFNIYRQLRRFCPDEYLGSRRIQLLETVQAHYLRFLDLYYDGKRSSTANLQLLIDELEAAQLECRRNRVFYDQFESQKSFIAATLLMSEKEHDWSETFRSRPNENAAALLESAIKVNPFEPAYVRQLARYYQGSHSPRGLWALTRLTELLPFDGFAWNELGVYYHEVGQHEKAIQAYQTAIRVAPGVALYYYNIGMCYYFMGKINESRVNLKRFEYYSSPKSDD